MNQENGQLIPEYGFHENNGMNHNMKVTKNGMRL